MKRIIGEEVTRVDSSRETLEKWYEFLKESAKNVAFGPNVYNNLKPFKKDGFKVPSVNEQIEMEDSGRIFYKITTADRIMMRHMVQDKYKTSYVLPVMERTLEYVMRYVHDFINRGVELPDIDGIDMAKLKKFIIDSTSRSDMVNNYRDNVFIEACLAIAKTAEIKILQKNVYDCSYDLDTRNKLKDYTNMVEPWVEKVEQKINEVTDEISFHDLIVSVRNSLETPSDTMASIMYKRESALNYHPVVMIKIKYFDNMFETLPFTTPAFIHRVEMDDLGSQAFINMVNEKYFVLSMNPVDKLMASTKQPYGSCLSLCSESSNEGSTGMNIANGTGLFALMPSDEVYMIYYCNGKHKNMYWEREEWMKQPEDRDGSKAYKFFKFTLRQFGYNCVMKTIHEAPLLEQCIEEDYPDHRDLFEERILPGRTYSVAGEIKMMELANAVLLDEVGVRTGFTTLRKAYEAEEAGELHSLLYHAPFTSEALIRGYMERNEICFYDKYGFMRGIYFDNVNLKNRVTRSIVGETNASLKGQTIATDTKTHEYSYVQTGCVRCGSGGVTERDTTGDINSFTFLSGKAGYSAFNQRVQICDKCGGVEYIASRSYGYDNTTSDHMLAIDGGKLICSECAKELGYHKCNSCGVWYTDDQKDEHKLIDLNECLPYPERIKDGSRYLCKKQLMKIEHTLENFSKSGYNREKDNSHICPICGEVHHDYFYTYGSDRDITKYVTKMTIDGVEIKARVCGTCLRDCMICDVCKKLVYIDPESTDPILLLPNKRIVCPHCVDKIRLEKKKKQALKEAMLELQQNGSEYVYEDSDVEGGDLDLLDVDEVHAWGSRSMTSLAVSPWSEHKRKRVKDVNKQIDSRTSRSGNGYPDLQVDLVIPF
jgi:hypothetical protein